MRQVLSTSDRSLVESLRVSLEAEGIDAVVTGDAGSGLPIAPVSVAVDGADYARAAAILEGLQRTPPQSWNGVALSPRLLRVFLLTLLVLAVAIPFVGSFTRCFRRRWPALGAALPNKRLKLPGVDRSKGNGALCPWWSTDFVPRPCAGGRVARSLSAIR